MVVSYNVQELLLTTRDTVTEAWHLLTIDQRSSLFSVVRSAQAEEQTYRARTALYEKKATVRTNWKPVMLISNPLDIPFDDYNTGSSTSPESELS